MAELVPAIHVFDLFVSFKAWMPGTRPGMTAANQRPLALLQIIEIGRDGLDLRLVQAVRDRLHDGRGVRFCRVLAPLLAPVHQFIEDVVVELARQAGKWPVALGIGAVTGTAGGNVGPRPLFVDFLSRRYEFFRGAAERFGIEVPEMRGERRYHL